MAAPKNRENIEALGAEIFELTNLTSRVRAQARKDDPVHTLTETENITLDLLSKNGVMTVGEIQKAVGVLPAQMSRIIRALEDKSGTALIECKINLNDRRKIDVAMTDEGRKAREAYRTARLAMTYEILGILTDAERDEFMRILRKIQSHVAKKLKDK